MKTFGREAQSFSHGWELQARLGGEKGGLGIPKDARFKPGSGGQLIAFVPSLDLVIARQTGSSGAWECGGVPAPSVRNRAASLSSSSVTSKGELA